ncbi:MAG TPA: hypothetical protein VH592_17190 [Gemmataceae bacterium]
MQLRNNFRGQGEQEATYFWTLTGELEQAGTDDSLLLGIQYAYSLFISVEASAMGRSHLSLAILLLACAALAAPAPQPRPFITGWETPIDPDRDCKITREKGCLIIEIPGSDHSYSPLRGQRNAPRLFREREIEGDFEMQVRVRIDSRPSDQSTIEVPPSFLTAGFLVILPDSAPLDYISYGYGLEATRTESGVERFFFVRSLVSKDKRPKNGQWLKEKPTINQERGVIVKRGWEGDVYLRLQRRRGNFADLAFSISPDGEKWEGLVGTAGIREKLKIGVIACSTSSKPSKIQFDLIKLTWPQPTKPQQKKTRQKEPLFEPSTVQVRR